MGDKSSQFERLLDCFERLLAEERFAVGRDNVDYLQSVTFRKGAVLSRLLVLFREEKKQTGRCLSENLLNRIKDLASTQKSSLQTVEGKLEKDRRQLRMISLRRKNMRRVYRAYRSDRVDAGDRRGHSPVMA